MVRQISKNPTRTVAAALKEAEKYAMKAVIKAEKKARKLEAAAAEKKAAVEKRAAKLPKKKKPDTLNFRNLLQYSLDSM